MLVPVRASPVPRKRKKTVCVKFFFKQAPHSGAQQRRSLFPSMAGAGSRTDDDYDYLFKGARGAAAPPRATPRRAAGAASFGRPR